MRLSVKVVAGLLLLTLVGCATQQTNLQQYKLADINHWQAKGKISFSANGERKSANFSWNNQGENYDIRLHGPFGSGAATLKRRNNIVSFTDSKQELKADSAEQLLFDATGWDLPISQLRWWIKALPAPDSSFENVINTNGDFNKLKQQGWQLRYKDYQLVSGHRLPGKIFATRDDIKIVLAIKQWSLKAL